MLMLMLIFILIKRRELSGRGEVWEICPGNMSMRGMSGFQWHVPQKTTAISHQPKVIIRSFSKSHSNNIWTRHLSKTVCSDSL